MAETSPAPASSYGLRNLVGLFLGPTWLLLAYLLPAPAALGTAGWGTAAIALLMATWWMTEAIPIPVTALLPLVLFPLVGAGSIGEAAAPYANPIVFLFLGGFLIATAMIKWNLHKRMALVIINFVGTSPLALIAGFMVATAFLSMWVSNTATSLMMLPVGISVIGLVDANTEDAGARTRFAVVLLLAIAYGANVGGMGTLVGTPPNAFLAGFFAEQYGFEISFLRWLLVGIPMMAVALPIVFFVLTKWIYPVPTVAISGGRALIRDQMSGLGPMQKGERWVALVFALTALLWVTRPLVARLVPGISDAAIAIAGGLALFVIPVNLRKGEFVHDWEAASTLPWGTLILFGGGLSLASAVTRSGLADWMAAGLAGLQVLPLLLLLLVVVTVIVFLTELASNLATTATFLPPLAALAVALGQNPLFFAIPATLGASCAFMLPAATPPNAVVYGSGRVSVPQMSRAGIVLNFIFMVVIVVLAYSILLRSFGVQVDVLPSWAI